MITWSESCAGSVLFVRLPLLPGGGEFVLARYDEATRLLRSAALGMPDHRPFRVLLPALSAAASDLEDLQRLAEALRKAGLPD